MQLLSAPRLVLPTRSDQRCRSAVDSRFITRSALCRSLRPSTGSLTPRIARVGSLPCCTRSVCQAASIRNQAAAGAALRYSPEVSQLLPAKFDLDLDLGDPDCLSGCLDPDKLAKAGNALSILWSESGALAQNRLAALPLAARRPASPDSKTDQHLLQCGLFCSQLVKLYQPFRSGCQHADFYALACLCLKVCNEQNTGFLLRLPLSILTFQCEPTACLGSPS